MQYNLLNGGILDNAVSPRLLSLSSAVIIRNMVLGSRNRVPRKLMNARKAPGLDGSVECPKLGGVRVIEWLVMLLDCYVSGVVTIEGAVLAL